MQHKNVQKGLLKSISSDNKAKSLDVARKYNKSTIVVAFDTNTFMKYLSTVENIFKRGMRFKNTIFQFNLFSNEFFF